MKSFARKTTLLLFGMLIGAMLFCCIAIRSPELLEQIKALFPLNRFLAAHYSQQVPVGDQNASVA